MIKNKSCQIRIIGSGTGVPYAKRNPPGILLKIEGKTVLMDAGAGTFQRLARIGISYQDIDYIFFSHLHPDHILDLISFLFAAKNPLARRRRKIVLLGPIGLKAFYEEIIRLHGSTIAPKSYKVSIKELDGDSLKYRRW